MVLPPLSEPAIGSINYQRRLLRILVCGDRNWTDWEPIRRFIAGLPKDTVIIEGEARGVDSIARLVAGEYSLEVEGYPANWELHGKAAGPIRNKRMLDEGKPNKVVFFHSDLAKSKGTKNMVEQARKAGIPVEDATPSYMKGGE